MMKFRLQVVIALGLSFFCLTACQATKTSQVSCQPVSNPFDDNPLMSESEYNGGYFPNIEIGKVCEFEGQVKRLNIYRQEIADGLVFCLKPDETGWEIAITDSSQNECTENYSIPVSPPWHGENPLFISGYQFRNRDNTGENDGSVNAYQEERGFNFVFSHNDFEVMQSAYRCSHWFVDCPTETSNKTVVYWSRGIMTITNLELGNLIPNERAWIDSMDFEVKVYLPAK
jgi:hypothetical protein